MNMDSVESIVERLRTFPWGTADRIDDEAEVLAREHVASMSGVLTRLGADRKFDAHQAYACAQFAGHDTPRREALTDALFDTEELAGLSQREHIILTIASFHCWTLDRDLGRLNNPWGPVMTLYSRGYQSGFRELDHPLALEVVFISRSDRRSYRIG
jgi:hypothetical protein